MKLVAVSKIFDVKYGVNLELNKLIKDLRGINFVSRTSKNNGVSAKVRPLKNTTPNPEGTISVAGGGSVMESFLQNEPYYSGRDLYYLVPKVELNDKEKIFYCTCLRANQYRFNYGRQANRTLRNILIPSKASIPEWVNRINIHEYDNAKDSFSDKPKPSIDTSKWKWCELQDLFTIKKGKRLTKANMIEGHIPFIGSIDCNNGYREYIGQPPIHTGNTITINYNGSVAEAFYQPNPFWASDDVNVLYPKFEMNQYIALFFVALIKMEKYRFNYGRKWHMQRMNISQIKLPVDESGAPDYEFMQRYIKALPFSKRI
jgi:Type I restriction modification DNA specificity domain